MGHMLPCTANSACVLCVWAVCVCRYASFDYEEGVYRPADLQRLDILAHGK